jgi:hypothetical protein
VNFDAIFTAILLNPELTKEGRRKLHEETLRREHHLVTEHIREAHVNGVCRILIDPGSPLSQEIRDALSVYCTIKEVHAYNRTKGERVFYGWEISWEL